MKNHELAKKEIFPLFIKYAIPSIGAMLIITIYTVVDAIFVGRGVGAVALGAVNQATPLILLINAFAAALATGAGIVISIRLGQKKKREANVAFTTIAIFNTILALLITTMGLLFTDNIATFLGANADTFGYVTSYLSIILYFMIFFVMQIRTVQGSTRKMTPLKNGGLFERSSSSALRNVRRASCLFFEQEFR